MTTNREAYLLRTATDIAATGRWIIQGVFSVAGDPTPPFAYTVGMTEVGLPELFVDGMDPRMAGQLLNALGDVQKSAGVPLEGEVDCGWNVPFRVRGPVDAEEAAVFVAMEIYPHPQVVSVMQVLWPDVAGRFPGEDGYDGGQFPQRVISGRGEG